MQSSYTSKILLKLLTLLLLLLLLLWLLLLLLHILSNLPKHELNAGACVFITVMAATVLGLYFTI